MMYLRVQLTALTSLKKNITSGWTPRWQSSDSGADLGPAQLTFCGGDVVAAGDKSIAIACPLSPRLWRVKSGSEVLAYDKDGTHVATGEVLEVFR